MAHYLTSLLTEYKKVRSESVPDQIALATHLQAIKARMYGSYWCPHCHAQQELFGLGKFGVNITRAGNLWKNWLFYPVIKAAAILDRNFPLLRNISISSRSHSPTKKPGF